MSVDRETLARVHGIPADQVKCANCARHSEFINDMLWCDGWDSQTRAHEFCSFFVKEVKDERTD